MRPLRELVIAVVLLVIIGVLARSSIGRFVLSVVGLAVAAALVALLATQSAYPRMAVGPQTRVIEPAAQSADTACVEYGSPVTARQHYIREQVILGVPVVLLDDGENPVYDAHRD